MVPFRWYTQTEKSKDKAKSDPSATAPTTDIEKLLSEFNIQWFKEIRHFPHPR